MKLKYKVLLVVAVAIILLDQITKIMVIERFVLGESISIIDQYFNLTYVRNTGAAFGILRSAPAAFRIPFFLLVPLVALGVMVQIFRKIPVRDWKLSAILASIMGGAVGNLIDRVRLGYVVDFLDFHWQYQAHFPAFNVADIAICVGVGFLLLDLILHGDIEKRSTDASATA